VPSLLASDFWMLTSHYMVINGSQPTYPLSLWFAPYALWKWRWERQFEMSFQIHEDYGTMGDSDIDSMKSMILDNDAWLVWLTLGISLLHVVFDMLAFKNDISFWRNRKGFDGVSLRTLCLSCVFQLVIILYLADNDTVWLVIATSSLGLLIDVWKITRAITVTVRNTVPAVAVAVSVAVVACATTCGCSCCPVTNYCCYCLQWSWNGRLPRPHIHVPESYTKSGTDEFDDKASRYLLVVVVPLVAGCVLHHFPPALHASVVAAVVLAAAVVFAAATTAAATAAATSAVVACPS
jgi:hypothetical protein